MISARANRKLNGTDATADALESRSARGRQAERERERERKRADRSSERGYFFRSRKSRKRATLIIFVDIGGVASSLNRLKRMQVKWHSSAVRSDIVRFNRVSRTRTRQKHEESIDYSQSLIRLNRSAACRTRSDTNIDIESRTRVRWIYVCHYSRYFPRPSCRSVAELAPDIFIPTGRKIALRLRRNWLVVI